MTLDLTGIKSRAELHQLVKTKLFFPEWWGVSDDAFWECIVVMVVMPVELTLTHWEQFAQESPQEMQILRQAIQDYGERMAPKRIVLA